MSDETAIRLVPIGSIRTPWKTLDASPERAGAADNAARLEILPEYAEGLHALKAEELDLLYWFDRAPRDVLRSVSPHAMGASEVCLPCARLIGPIQWRCRAWCRCSP